MNVRYKLLILVVSVSVLQACKKKELPEVEDGAPVFMVNTNVKGNAVSVVAGKDNYYMFTSKSLDGLGINVLSGTLGSKQCVDCNHAFTISYRDSYFRNNLIINNISDILKPGNYLYYNGVDTTSGNLFQGTLFNFSAYVPAGTNYTYNWDFGDGSTAQGANTSHQYNEPADYNVCLTVSSPGYPNKTICNVITTDTNCRFQFYQSIVQNFVNFSTDGNSNAYAWDFGDATSIQLTGITTSHTYSQAGIYRVVLSDTSSGLTCSNIFQKDILVGNFNGNEIPAGFNYTYSLVTSVGPSAPDSGFRKVVVNYTAPNGNKYSTYNAYDSHSQINNNFVVSKADPYQNNSAGLKTYKLEGNFKAWLYNVSNANDSIYIETTKFIMGVAYP